MGKTIALSINTSWNVINFRLGLIAALQQAGHNVVVVAPKDTSTPELIRRNIAFQSIDIDNKGRSFSNDVKLLFDYRSIFKRVKPDLFLGYTIKPNVYGSLAAATLGIPVINNISGLGTAFIRSNWLTRMVSALYRVALARSKTVFFQNEEDQRLFVARRLTRPDQAALLPGSGIDLIRFATRPLSLRDDTCFLLMARLLRDKGVSEFVTAARALRSERADVRFQVLGFLDVKNATAISRAEIDSWVADGTIEYLGDTDDVRPFIAAADCVVLPSYREGLPRSLLEAGAIARPAIATDVPGCRAVIRPHENGLLCAPRSADDLAGSMREFLAMSVADRTAMGQRARKIVEAEFDERIVIDRIVAAVDRAIGR